MRGEKKSKKMERNLTEKWKRKEEATGRNDSGDLHSDGEMERRRGDREFKQVSVFDDG